MWQKDTAPSTYTWQQALSYCENLILNNDSKWTNGTPNASGIKYDDWRMPNINELQSLVDYERCNPAIDPIFPNTQTSYYLSSTTNSYNNPNEVWIVSFSYGDVYGNYKYPYNGYYVRAVRGGQCGSLTTTTTSIGSITTTTTTTVQSCPTEQIYGEHSAETELLRYIRDNVLNQTPEGQEIIKLYFEWGLIIVEMMNEDEEFKEQVKEMIDEVLPLLGETWNRIDSL